jgi:LPXTG-motif cell wall-anchored protein
MITNTYVAGAELPATGGSGTLIFTITGIFLITLAGTLLVARKRKANR